MIDGTFHVQRWTADKHPYVPGVATLWSCTLELRGEIGRVSFGLDLSYGEMERLSALVAHGSIRLSEIFGASG